MVISKEPLRHFLSMFIYFLGIRYILRLGLRNTEVKVANQQDLQSLVEAHALSFIHVRHGVHFVKDLRLNK